jgi:hypothetical protein
MFSAATSIENPFDSCCTVRLSVRDLIVPYYDLLLHTYTHTIHGAVSRDYNGNKATAYSNEPLAVRVAELPSFVFTDISEAEAFLRQVRGPREKDTDTDSIRSAPSNYYDYIKSSLSFWAPSSVMDSKRESGASHSFGTVSWSIELPPGHHVTTHYKAVKRLLHRESYPNDASRGLEIPPTFIDVHWQHNGSVHTMFTSTDPGLIAMPIPDFSMPFNVITLVSNSCVLTSISDELVSRKTVLFSCSFFGLLRCNAVWPYICANVHMYIFHTAG